ncbi:MAG TPA: hypothetical protein VMV69_17135 [Pirellulales bacterium]|nr:hypothetical protein [Pirellulales bacterium]
MIHDNGQGTTDPRQPTRHVLLSPFSFLFVSSRWQAAAAAAWVPWALLAGAAMGWLAARVQPYFAPLVVFPVLVGLLLSMALIAGLRVCSLAHAPTTFAGAVLAAVLAVGGQHYWSYRAACDAQAGAQANLDKARRAFPDLANRLMSPPPPAGTVEYLRAEADRGRKLFGHRVRGRGLWSWWALEAVLVFVAAILPLVWALRRPYCIRCHSWHRASRSGRVSAAVASELAHRCGLPCPKSAGGGAFRLLTCRSGCGPSLFELSWADGGETGRAWLDADARRVVAAVLDRDTLNSEP